MPLVKCQKNGKQGWKFGREGKCYVGRDAKKKATEQGQAIHAEKNKK